MVVIYDSGVGGLTSLFALRRLCPHIDVAYFGDTAHVPYGTHSEETICRYAEAMLNAAAALSPEAVLVACGTVSSVCLPQLAEKYPFPIHGILEAGAEEALRAAPGGRIALLGTEATIRKGTLARLLHQRRRGLSLRGVACPLFVPLVECGYTDPFDPIPRMVAIRMLAPLGSFSPEAMLLGCTHFPWLSRVIGPLYPKAKLIDCGKAAARRLVPHLKNTEEEGRTVFYLTEEASTFRRTAERICGKIPEGEYRALPQNE